MVCTEGRSWRARAAIWVAATFSALLIAAAASPARAAGPGYVVCLDPGHTLDLDRDRGAVTQAAFGSDAFELREVDLNLEVAHALRGALLEHGVGVVMTWDGARAGWPETGAPDDPPPPFISADPISHDSLGLEARGRRCVAAGAHVMFSVHHNALPGPGDGLITLFRDPGSGQYDRDRAVAKVVHQAMWSALGRSKPARVFTDFGLYFEDWGIARGAIGIPAVILEPVIITDPLEARWLTPTIAQGGVRRRQIVEAELAAILASRTPIFNVATSGPPAEVPERARGEHDPQTTGATSAPGDLIRLSAGAGTAPLRVDFTSRVDNAFVYAWSFGDGEFAYGRTTRHVYQRPGLFVVRSTACNLSPNIECVTATATVNVQARKPPDGETVKPGQPVYGSIDRPGELNHWRFRGNARDRATLSLRAADASPVDPVLRLIGPDGSLVAFNDDFEKRSDARIESVQLPLSGEYVVEASAFGDSEGAYALELTVTPGDHALAAFIALPATAAAPADVRFLNQSENATSFRWNFGDGTLSAEWSPAHRFQAAGRFPVTLTACSGEDCSAKTVTVVLEEPDGRGIDGNAPVRGLIDFEDDIDTWVFSAPKGAEVTIDLVATGGAFDPLLFLRGPDGVELAKSADGPGGKDHSAAIANFILPVNGTYTIDALAGPGSGTGHYQLTIAIDRAPVIRPAVQVSEQDPVAPAEIVFSDSSLGGPTSSAWDFGDGSGGSGREIRHRFQRAGTFVVRLQSCNARSCGEWTVRLRIRESLGGGPLSVDETAFGAVDGPEDEDVWVLRGAAGQVVTIAVRAESSSLDLVLDVLGPSGALLASGDRSGGQRLIERLSLPTTGDYRLRVRGIDVRAQGRYRIQVSGAQPSPG